MYFGIQSIQNHYQEGEFTLSSLPSQTLFWLKAAIILALNLCLIAFAVSSSRTTTTVLQEETAPVVSQYGSSGSEVTKIQQRLKAWGYFDGPVTGNYGTLTTEAVKKFQRAHGLSVTGIADAATLEKIGLPSGTASTSSGSTGSSDYQLLARIISAEARGEPYIGQVAVGAVILNRVEHPSFPDSIAGVVYQPGAFTAITDGQINQPVSESAYRAAKEALNGNDPTGGAIYYYNPSKTSNKWIRSRPVITQIGDHLFCS